MSKQPSQSPYLDLLHNRIDLTKVPFSDRGSRILVYTQASQNHLFIKLAERLTSIQPGIESYLKRPAYIPELSFINSAGSRLEFNLDSFPHLLLFHTEIGTFTLAFHSEDTLAIGMPESVRSGIRLRMEGDLAGKDRDGGCIQAIRPLHYRSNDVFTKHIVTAKGELIHVDLMLEAGIQNTIHLTPEWPGYSPQPFPPPSISIQQAEARWDKWFSSVPQVSGKYAEIYYYAWWVIANNLVSPLGHLHYEAMMPSKHFYVGVWNWDACLHALALRHVDIDLARNQLRTVLDWQSSDGMLPDAVYDEGVVDHIDHPVSAKVTKPPIMAWVVMKLHQSHPDRRFLEEVYPALVRWNNWWFSENDGDSDGIIQYTHPYSSGLDDSPLWDHGLPVESPDLNTYLCLQMQSLAKMAEELDRQREASTWQGRSDAFVTKMVEHFYDPDSGLFWATHNHQHIPEVTPFNLYPLWTGQLDDEIKEKIIAHLTNPDEFWAPYPLTTVARNSKSYSPEIMWRGPVWANINYFFIEALKRSCNLELAQELRECTMAMIAKSDGIYEFYNPETGQASERAVPMFGWTAAVLIDLLVQE